jgi:hypothetical protein
LRNAKGVIAVNQTTAPANMLPFVQAEINYLAPMAERPRNYTYDPPEGIPRSNMQAEAHLLPTRNIHSRCGQVSLDREGCHDA